MRRYVAMFKNTSETSWNGPQQYDREKGEEYRPPLPFAIQETIRFAMMLERGVDAEYADNDKALANSQPGMTKQVYDQLLECAPTRKLAQRAGIWARMEFKKQWEPWEPAEKKSQTLEDRKSSADKCVKRFGWTQPQYRPGFLDEDICSDDSGNLCADDDDDSEVLVQTTTADRERHRPWTQGKSAMSMGPYSPAKAHSPDPLDR